MSPILSVKSAKKRFFCTIPKNKKSCKYLIYRILLDFALILGGSGGIRTPGTVARTSV